MNIELKEIIDASDNIVFFGGAGVSTESGIPDFRSESGLYNAKKIYGISPEELISHTAFRRDPELFFRYYKENLIFPSAKPNPAHYALAKLEDEGKVKAVITQNIDGLHQAAGSKNVFELHGAVARNDCTKCGAHYDLDYILDPQNCINRNGNAGNIPYCARCGGIVKPDVVLYEEPLDEAVISGAVDAISNAEVLIVGGTSLAVYPAAGFLRYFTGTKLVLINKTETGIDHKANLVIHEPIGEVLGAVVRI